LVKEKAWLLFDEWDLDGQNHLSVYNIEDILDDYFRLACGELASLGIGMDEDNLLDKASIDRYRNKLLDKIPTAVKALISDLFYGRESVTKESLINFIMRDENHRLVTASGVRDYINTAVKPLYLKQHQLSPKHEDVN
jgi:hypothetical protein